MLKNHNFTRKYPRNCHVGDVLLYGKLENQFDILGVNDTVGLRLIALYVRKHDTDDPAFWVHCSVNDRLYIYTPNK